MEKLKQTKCVENKCFLLKFKVKYECFKKKLIQTFTNKTQSSLQEWCAKSYFNIKNVLQKILHKKKHLKKSNMELNKIITTN